MRVVQICHKSPFPPNDGGTLASYQLSKAMLELGWKVKLLCIGTPKHPFKEYPLDMVFKAAQPESIHVDTTPNNWSALKSVWRKENYLVDRFWNEEFANLIKTTLIDQDVDLVIFDGAFTAMYIDDVKHVYDGATVLRSHNVEFQLWEDRLQNETSSVKKWLMQKMVTRLKDFELSELKKVDAIGAISMTDKAFFNAHFGLNKSFYLPFGISLPEKPLEDQNTKNKLVFLGALDWEPNLEGLNWFLKKVWPTVVQRMPSIEFHIGGRNAPEGFADTLTEKVFYHGEVPDAHAFMLSGEVMVVPLLSGSGIRIKIIEGMALGMVIATTTKGVEGIPVQNERDVLIADTPSYFSHQIIEAFRKNAQRDYISRQSRLLAEKEFDITNTQKALLDISKTIGV